MQKYPVKDPRLTIDKIFPVELYSYCIVDGEKLEELLTYHSDGIIKMRTVKTTGCLQLPGSKYN